MKRKRHHFRLTWTPQNSGVCSRKSQSCFFWDKIGQAMSVKFQFKSAIWRSETGISSRYLEITCTTKTDILTFLKNKRLLRGKFKSDWSLITYHAYLCERFEPRSHFKRLSLIVRVNVVLNRTVVVDSDWRFDNLCGSHLQSQSELYHVS